MKVADEEAVGTFVLFLCVRWPKLIPYEFLSKGQGALASLGGKVEG